ncbi:MAG: flagellar M-ring protein FliF [Alphaproteobacteria bacterium]|nr:flagellar M-ring protein FliF [Alphaproteobacteria bacterium]
MANDGDEQQVETATPPADPLARLTARVKRLGPARLAAIGGLVLGLAGFAVFLAFSLGRADYALLFTDLEPADAQTVVERLEAMDVPHRLTRDGSAILVPEGERMRLRMALAEDGLPGSGRVGYEIFDDRSLLGSTQFEANVNLLRALEGELGRTIATLGVVDRARVHLVQPERELFQRETARASASVVVNLGRRGGLGAEQVAAIRQLVAGAVPWLEATQVTVVDDRGQLLASTEESVDGALPGRAETFQRQQEERIGGRIRGLLERSLGPGNVEVSVSAEIDFDQVTTTSEEYDPDSQIARSRQTVEESSEFVDPEDPAVTVENNLPTGDETAAGPASSERTTRTEETVNFEISKTVRNHVQTGGRIRRLSIAVLVDGTYTTNAAGESIYEPRSEAELAEIASLVRGAAGVDAERGDVVEVVNRPFAAPAPAAPPARDPWTVAGELWRTFGEAATLILATLLVVVFVARPLLKKAFPAAPAPALETDSGLTVTHEGQVLVEPGSAAAVAAEVEQEQEQMLQLNQIRGQIRASLLGRVTGLIDDHPEEATRVVRHWLHTD